MSGHRYQDAAGPPSPSVASPYESAQLPAVDGHYYPPAEPSTPDGLSPPPTLYNQKNDSRGYQPVVSSNYGTKSGSRYSSYNSQSQHPLKNATYADSQTLRGSQEDIKDPKGSFLRGDSAFKRFSGFTVPARTSSTDSEPTPRRKRLGYLDGLKFLAAWVVLNGTLLDNAIPDDVSACTGYAACRFRLTVRPCAFDLCRLTQPSSALPLSTFSDRPIWVSQPSSSSAPAHCWSLSGTFLRLRTARALQSTGRRPLARSSLAHSVSFYRLLSLQLSSGVWVLVAAQTRLRKLA